MEALKGLLKMMDFFGGLFDRFYEVLRGAVESIFNWSPDDEPDSYSPEDEAEDEDSEAWYEVGARLMYDDEGGEYVATFASIGEALDYVTPTPEMVLRILIDDGGVHVYRFDS